MAEMFMRFFGTVKRAYLPVLITYFCYEASAITTIALLFFQKEALGITPADAAAIAFWVALPWNLALSASELFTRDLNTAFGVTRQDYSNLGRLMIAVSLMGLVPLLALPLLRREETRAAPASPGALRYSGSR
jgi:hypothetical protein